MNDSPDDRIYSDQHIWLLLEDEDNAKIGITDFAQSELGDIVYIELPEEGQLYEEGQSCAVVESVKTASEIISPVSIKVIEANADLSDSPEIINEDPYDNGWLCRVEIQDKAAIDSLMSADQYDSSI